MLWYKILLKMNALWGNYMPLIVEVKVVPSSGKSLWKIDKSGVLKGYLKNPAARGLANEELIKAIAQALRLPQQDVTIMSGQTQRNKRIKINKDITYPQLLSALGIDQQLKIM